MDDLLSSTKPPKSFHFSKAVFVIVPSITGSISFLSSLAVAFVILRSKSNGVYHRILLLMSLCDMMSSSAIALATLPMPSDVIYPFAFPSYGTKETCEVQGFMIQFGSGSVLMLGLVLNIYYLCKLRYNLEDAKFSHSLEPILYLVTFLSMLIPFIIIWKQGAFNPALSDPFCTIREYPDDCTEETDEVGCRGVPSIIKQYEFTVFAVLILAFGSLIVTMVLIIHSFRREEKRLKKHANRNPDVVGESIPIEEIRKARDSRRIVTKQATMYLAALTITWIFLFLEHGLSGVHNNNTRYPLISLMRMVFQPLQGFFNMVIFFYHKIRTMRKSDEDITVAAAFLRLISSPKDVPECVAIENIDLVRMIELYHQYEEPVSVLVPCEEPIQEGAIWSVDGNEPDVPYNISPGTLSNTSGGFYRRDHPKKVPELPSSGVSFASKSLGGFENVEDVSFAASSKCRSVLSSAAVPPSSKSLDVPFAAPPREEIDNTERNHQKGKDEGKEYNDDVEF